MTEERALDELVRNRRHVDGDERRVAVSGFPVQQPRQQLLACAALAEDEHCRRELGDLVHHLDDLAHLLARSEVELAVALLGHLRAERHHLAIEILPLARIAHERAQLVVVEILRDVVIGAVLHGLHGGLDLVDGRDHDALDEAVVLLDDAQDVEAADAWQADVEEHHVDFLLPQQRQRRLAARDRQDAVVAPEDRGDRLRACPDRRRKPGWFSWPASSEGAIVSRPRRSSHTIAAEADGGGELTPPNRTGKLDRLWGSGSLPDCRCSSRSWRCPSPAGCRADSIH